MCVSTCVIFSRHISDRRERSCLQASSLRDDSLHSTRSGVECGGIDVSPPGPGGTSCTPGPGGGTEADEWTSNHPSLTKLVLGGRISIGSSSPSSSFFFFFFRRVFVSFFFESISSAIPLLRECLMHDHAALILCVSHLDVRTCDDSVEMIRFVTFETCHTTTKVSPFSHPTCLCTPHCVQWRCSKSEDCRVSGGSRKGVGVVDRTRCQAGSRIEQSVPCAVQACDRESPLGSSDHVDESVFGLLRRLAANGTREVHKDDLLNRCGTRH